MVLPAYNERECIADAVGDCLAFLPTCFERYEVVVVDDGSHDGTGDVVRELEARHPGVVVGVFHGVNRGYGAAIMSGFRKGSGDLLFYTDADRQFDVSEIEHAVEKLEDERVDAVYGFRVYRYDSVLRCMTSWVYNRLVRVLFGVKVRDVDCAFKLYRREVLDGLDIACTDFFIDTELVARARKKGVKACEIGVRHFPRTAGRTTVRPGDVPRTLLTVARMWLLIHFGIGKGRTIARDPGSDDVLVPKGRAASPQSEVARPQRDAEAAPRDVAP
ncbi:MAG: glycosyltransferase family 2 protein [Planctomycetota bacterium]